MGKKAQTADAVAAAAPAAGEAPLSEAEKASPVLRAIGKRMRAARKKLNRIAQLEQQKADGKELNADQEETIRAKTGTQAIIEELGKLEPLLTEAAAEEASAAVAAAKEKERLRAERRAAREAEAAEAEKPAEAESKPEEEEPAAPAEPETAPSAADVDSAVSRLVDLLYFSQLFDSSTMHHQVERSACLTYDFTSGEEGERLSEADLDAIPAFGKLLISRDSSRPVSHRATLEECKRLAHQWLSSPEAQLPNTDLTVGALTARLERVLRSQYMTTEPQVKQPEELEAVLQDHAAAQQQALHAAHAQHVQHIYGHFPEADFSGQGGALAVSQAEAVLAPAGLGREAPPGAHHVSTLEMQMGIHQPQQQHGGVGLPEMLGMGDGGYGGQHLGQQPPPPPPMEDQFGGGYASAAGVPFQQHAGAFGSQDWGAPPAAAPDSQPQFNFMTDSNIGVDAHDPVAPMGAPSGNLDSSVAVFSAPEGPTALAEPAAAASESAPADSAPEAGSDAAAAGGSGSGALPNGVHYGGSQQNGVQGGRGGRFGGGRGGGRGRGYYDGRGRGGRGRFDGGRGNAEGGRGEQEGGGYRGGGRGGGGGYQGGRGRDNFQQQYDNKGRGGRGGRGQYAGRGFQQPGQPQGQPQPAQ